MTSHQTETPGGGAVDYSIVLCGAAGQGIQTVEELFSDIVRMAGFYVFSTKEYMSRVRGGSNSTQIRISTQPVGACLKRMDILIPLSRRALEHVADRITDETLIVGEKETLGTDRPVYDVSFSAIAQEVGSKLYANTAAVGLICGLLAIDASLLDQALSRRFTSKGEKMVQNNSQAAQKGYSQGAQIALNASNTPNLKTIKLSGMATPREDSILVNGAQAVALGALCGGCNFIGSYPMSPGTGVLTVLAGCSHEVDIVVEQAEDEIAAINMAMGAWYAGARALVTTSGGGFALMGEGLSLAGMIESPLVIHLAQRPGPATGLPTRTEQGDLNLALYAGHGTFPRIVLAPGTLAQAFEYTRMAFELADQYQVPVFILTDQFLMDSYAVTPRFAVPDDPPEAHIVETGPGYRRFALTNDGISPRGIPGFGSGIVCLDSDEHTEQGYITEDMAVRNAMVEKRMAKLRTIETMDAQSLPPTFWGEDTYHTLVLCWGSTYAVVKEAVASLDREGIAVLHFGQIFPLPPKTLGYLKSARTTIRTIAVENNVGGQFAALLKQTFGFDVDHTIVKYSGLAFTVEEVAVALMQNLDAGE